MEKLFNLSKAAQAVTGELRACDGNTMITSVSTDTRSISEGALFVALRGESFDGHRYVQNAVDGGAVCCVVERGADIPDGIPAIIVKSTSQALLDLAGAYRREMNIPVIAVTGSVGKTSTRGMIASVLSQKYKTLATNGNFNNEIGVPHTLFRLSKGHEIAVIEMGMNHFGELSRITEAVRPDTAVITNVGEAHIENLGSREGILRAKLEVLEGLTHGGTVVLNGDNDMLWSMNGKLEFETLYCGIDNKLCDLTAAEVRTYADGTEFRFCSEGKEYTAVIEVAGLHHVYNALCAIVVGTKYNVPIEGILRGIREFVPDGMRQAEVKLGRYTLIKDCYNANPTSMKSGLEVLALRTNVARRVACLGDMLELGTISEKAHYGIGKFVAEGCADCLITVGEKAEMIAKGALDSGMDEKNVFSFSDNAALCAAIDDIVKDGDVILFKASRGMRLEEVAEYLEKKERAV